MSERLTSCSLSKTVALPAACLIANLIFVLQPSLIYGPYFAFALLPVLTILVAAGLVTAVLLTLPAFGTRYSWQSDYGAFLAAIAIGLWVSSTLTIGSPAVIDGRSLEVSPNLEAAVGNMVVVLGAASVAYLAGSKRPDWTRFFLWILNTLFAVVAVFNVSSLASPAAPKSGREAWGVFSSKGNVLILLLDSYQSSFFAELLEQEPILAESLDGFDFFRNASSTAPTTMFSLPAIHSGRAFAASATETVRFDDYFSTAIREESFLASLSKAGFRTQLLNPLLQHCPNGVECAPEAFLHLSRTQLLKESTLLLLGMSLYTVSPLQWKQFVYNDGEWLIGADPVRSAVIRGYETLDWMRSFVSVDNGPPVARFVHLLTTHPPAVVDENCTKQERVPLTERALLDQARCTNRAVVAFLSSLRASGVYDNSLIIILADHGAGVSEGGFFSGGSASPLLLIKNPGSSGSLRVDLSLVSISEIRDKVCGVTSACLTEPTVEPASGRLEPRRHFIDYIWNSDGWMNAKIPEINWYQLDGRPEDFESWRRVAPSIRPVSHLTGDSRDSWSNYGLGWTEVEDRGKKTRWVHGTRANVFLNLPEERAYSVSVSLEPRLAAPAVSTVELYADGEHKATHQVRQGGQDWVSFTVNGKADSYVELVFFSERAPGERFSVDARRPRFRFNWIEVR